LSLCPRKKAKRQKEWTNGSRDQAGFWFEKQLPEAVNQAVGGPRSVCEEKPGVVKTGGENGKLSPVGEKEETTKIVAAVAAPVRWPAEQQSIGQFCDAAALSTTGAESDEGSAASLESSCIISQ
jgi:hypothetical protein